MATYIVSFLMGIVTIAAVIIAISENLNLKRDWRVVWVEQGTWIMTYARWSNETYSGKEYCCYEIRYSPSRKKYKLRMKGRSPKEHNKYKLAIKKLNEFYEQV